MIALTFTGVLVVATVASVTALVVSWMVVAWALRPVRRSSSEPGLHQPWLNHNPKEEAR